MPDKTDIDSDIVILDEELEHHGAGRKAKTEDRFTRIELIPAYRTSTPMLVKPMRIHKTPSESEQDTMTEDEGEVAGNANMTSAELKAWFSTVMSKKIDAAIDEGFTQLASSVNQTLIVELQKRDKYIRKLVQKCNQNAQMIKQLSDKISELLRKGGHRGARVVAERDNVIVINGLEETNEDDFLS